VREFIRSCFAVLFMFVLMLAMAWTFGFTAQGLLYGHWPPDTDHPTNWNVPR